MVCFLASSFEFRPDLLFITINRTVMQMTSSRNSTTPTPAKVGVMTSTTIADASSEDLESEFPAIRFNCLVHMLSDWSKLTIISLLFYCMNYMDAILGIHILFISTVTGIGREQNPVLELCVKYNKPSARSIRCMTFDHILLVPPTKWMFLFIRH